MITNHQTTLPVGNDFQMFDQQMCQPAASPMLPLPVTGIEQTFRSLDQWSIGPALGPPVTAC